MMEKPYPMAPFVALALLCALAACSADTTPSQNTDATQDAAQDQSFPQDSGPTSDTTQDAPDPLDSDLLEPDQKATDTPPSDGASDVTPAEDSAPEEDTTGPDTVELSCAETGCPDGSFCYLAHDVCVADCGDQSAIEAALAELNPTLKVVQNRCTSPGENYFVRQSAAVIEIHSNDTQLRLSRWELAQGLGLPPVDFAMFPLPNGVTFDDFTGFLSPFFAAKRSQGKLSFGYTTSGLTGEIVIGVPPSGDSEASNSWTFQTIAADGNYGASFMNPTTLLINGLGALDLGGQGLYGLDLSSEPATASLLVTNLGTYSGAVDGSFGNWLIGGFEGFGTTWPDGSEGNRVYAITKEQMAEAIESGTAIDAVADGQLLDIGSDFTFEGQNIVVTKDVNDSWEVTGLTRHKINWDANGQVAIENTFALTTGSSFDAARVVPETQSMLLRHPMGYLLVKGQAQ